MKRHAFLVKCALAIPLCGCLPQTWPALAGETGTTPHWGYAGTDGPDRWGSLSTDFATCGVGAQQSPINLNDADAISANIGKIQLAYHSTPLRIVNNGHTIQVNCEPGSSASLRGHSYDLKQFHFHTPSEHTHNGNRYAMELHLVHQNAAENIAVLGVFIKEGAANPALDPIWQHIPATPGPEQTVSGARVDAASLIPASSDYFAYLGSLTTPPCTEGVRWFVFAQPVSASREQIGKFRSVIAMNSRPLQSLDHRFVLEQL